LASPNFLEEQVAFSHMRQFKRTAQMRRLPDPDGVNYARPLKVTKVERFFKRVSYACTLIFKSSRLPQKTNSCLWPRPSV
jgi:hypothetical protein